MIAPVRHLGCPPAWLYGGATALAFGLIVMGLTWLNFALFVVASAGWGSLLRAVTRDDVQRIEIFVLHLADGDGLYEGRDYIR